MPSEDHSSRPHRNRNRRPRSHNEERRQPDGDRAGRSDRWDGQSPNRDRPKRHRSPKEAPATPLTLGRKLLRIFSFGLLGKPAAPKEKSRVPGRGQNEMFRREPRPSGDLKSTREPKQDSLQPRQRRESRGRGLRDDRPQTEVPPSSPDSITNPRLHVGNLSFDASEGDLFELFNGVGKVQNVEIIVHRKTQRSKGFGFVQMAGLPAARRAVEVLHGQSFMGRQLYIGSAKNPQDRHDDDNEDEPPPVSENLHSPNI